MGRLDYNYTRVIWVNDEKWSGLSWQLEFGSSLKVFAGRAVLTSWQKGCDMKVVGTSALQAGRRALPARV